MPVMLLLVVLACLLPAPAAHAHGSLHEKIAALSSAIEREPHDASLFLERGELHRLHGDLEAAAADYDRAAALDPSLLRVDLCRGALRLAEGLPAQALEPIGRFLAREPDHAEALLLRARARAALGERLEAVRDMDRALGLLKAPTPDHFLERARLLAQAGGQHREEALRGLDEARSRLGPVVSLERLAAELRGSPNRADPAPPRGDPPGSGFRAGGAPAVQAHVPPPPTSRSEGGLTTASSTVVGIPRRAVWKYRDTPSDLGTAWRSPAFDDTSWPSGPGVLGYGESYIATLVPYGPSSTNRYPTTYFRAAFDVANPAGIQTMVLAASYDDGFVAYLNGQEVARRGLPAGPVGYSTYAASHEGGAYDLIDLSAFVGLLAAGTNVLAVELHQASASSSDLVLDMELRYSTGPAVVTRGPYLQKGTTAGAVVRWRTFPATDSRVRYGFWPGGLGLSVTDATVTTEHEVALTNLSPGMRYFYSAGSSAGVAAGDDAGHSFVTAPPDGVRKPTRIWIVGDSGLPGQDARDVRDAFLAWTGSRVPDVWLMLGDNAYSYGTDDEYQVGLFDLYAEMLRQVVLWPTRGNHDYLYSGAGNDYYDIFTMPTAGEAGGIPSGSEAYYSFDYGNIHFICLDSEGSDRSSGGAMLTWLASDLAATDKEWVIAFWHHPPYSKGSHDSDDALDSGGRMRDMRANALPILDAAGVDLVLTGHSHSYERSFLLDGHYGTSGTLTNAMKVDAGDGRPGGDGPYQKETLRPAPHQGAVYAVAGSSSRLGGGTLDHPVMISSLNVLGSLVLDVDAWRLDARFIAAGGAVLDSFTMVKDSAVGVGDRPRDLETLRLGPARPNPFALETRIAYSLPLAGPARVFVCGVDGRRLVTLVDGPQAAGPHEALWDGRDERGRSLSSGIYFVALESGGERRSRRTALVR